MGAFYSLIQLFHILSTYFHLLMTTDTEYLLIIFTQKLYEREGCYMRKELFSIVLPPYKTENFQQTIQNLNTMMQPICVFNATKM